LARRPPRGPHPAPRAGRGRGHRGPLRRPRRRVHRGADRPPHRPARHPSPAPPPGPRPGSPGATPTGRADREDGLAGVVVQGRFPRRRLFRIVATNTFRYLFRGAARNWARNIGSTAPALGSMTLLLVMTGLVGITAF